MLSLIRRYAPWPLARLSSFASGDWLRFRQANSSMYDEVTEAAVSLYGTAQLTDGKLVARPAALANYASFHTVTFGDDEDFYIRVTAKLDAPASNIINLPILSVWGSTAQPESAWTITHAGPAHPSLVGRPFFSYRTSDGSQSTVRCPTAVPYTQENTFEVVRLAGTILFFLNGVLQDSTVQSLGNGFSNFHRLQLFRLNSNGTAYVAAGEIYDIQIIKAERGFPTQTHDVSPVPQYIRAVYDRAVSDALRLQLGFRRGSNRCEINGTPVTLNGTAAIGTNARLTQTNATASWASIPVPYFGAADFTIEFMCNLSVISANGLRIGHWTTQGGGPDAVWGILINSNRRISFAIQRTEVNSDWIHIVTADGAFLLNRDNHIVVERVGDVCTIYLNGKVVASGDMPIPIRKAGMFRTNGFSGTDSCAGSFWNVRIADRAMYRGEIKTRATYPSMPLPPTRGVRTQFRFEDNEAINEVTEHHAALTGAAAVSGGQIATGTTAADGMQFPTQHLIGDFTVELKINPVSMGTNGSAIGVWNGSPNPPGAQWGLTFAKSTGGVWAFYMNGVEVVRATTQSPLNVPVHIAVTRRYGLVRIFLDGVVSGEAQYTGDNTPAAGQPLTRLNDGHAANWIQGTRWDIRISDKCLYDSSFTPRPLDVYVPEFYADDEQDVVLQLGMRRDSMNNEANPKQAMTLSGTATVLNGNLVTTSVTSSWFSCPVRKWGQGDFTLECVINITSIAASGIQPLAQFHGASAGQDSDNNRWGLQINQARNVSFLISRSARGGDYAIFGPGASYNLPLNTDLHIVIERIAGLTSMHVNGERVAQTSALNLPILGEEGTHFVKSQDGLNYRQGAFKLSHIRIVDRAMYNGQVKRLTALPKFKPKLALNLIENGVIDDRFTNVGVTVENGALRIRNNQYLAAASGKARSFALARDNFTIEAELTIHSHISGTESAVGTSTTTIVSWNTWGAPTQQMNYEFFYNNISKNLTFIGNGVAAGTGVALIRFPVALELGVRYNIKLVRRNGVLYMLVDDVVIGTTAWPQTIAYINPSPFKVGRRQGGGSGEANWFSDMTLYKLEIINEARL